MVSGVLYILCVSKIHDIGAEMPFEEKRAWIQGLVSAGGYAWYLAAVLERAGDGPIVDVAYQWPMITATLAAMIASVVAHTATAIAYPGEGRQRDERDAAIHRHGESISRYVLGACAVVPLGLAMLECDHFWIANSIYLAAVLTELSSATLKIVAYRRGV
jgi:hypothetical protein